MIVNTQIKQSGSKRMKHYNKGFRGYVLHHYVATRTKQMQTFTTNYANVIPPR